MHTGLRERQRVLLLLAVVLGHALLIQVMRNIAGPRVPPSEERRVLPISLLPLPAAPQAAAAPTDALPAPQDPQRLAPDRVQSLVPVPPPQGRAITLPEESAPSPPRPRDWAGDAARLADQLVNDTPGYRVFGPRQREEEPPADAERPNIFAPPTSRRAGDIEMLDSGVERRWLSPYCYREFGGPPEFFAGRRTRQNPVTCLRGSSEPRSDLFDHLKPDYLRDEEEE